MTCFLDLVRDVQSGDSIMINPLPHAKLVVLTFVIVAARVTAEVLGLNGSSSNQTLVKNHRSRWCCLLAFLTNPQRQVLCFVYRSFGEVSGNTVGTIYCGQSMSIVKHEHDR
jgi:hypothetical protein